MDKPRVSLKRKLAIQLTIVCAFFAVLFVLEIFLRLYLNCSGVGSWWGRVPVNPHLCVVFSKNHLEAEILRYVSAMALTQVLKVAVVGLFCAIVFHRGVTRHISAMAAYLKQATTQETPGALKLNTNYLTTPVTELHDIENNLNAIMNRLRGIAKAHAKCDHDHNTKTINEDLAVQLERMSATCAAVTSILHDVNNGLSVLLHNPEHIERLMSLDNGVNQETKESVGKILETQERIVAMMAKLIATQQTTAAVMARSTVVSLRDVVTDTIEIEGMKFQRAGISLKYKSFEDYSVKGSREIYTSILMNLFKNAREAIITGNSERREVLLRSWKEANEVVFEICDSGCGIAPEKLNQIGNHGFSTKATGQGLGLAGARRMLAEMNGWLAVDSPGTGLGATVRIGLPAV